MGISSSGLGPADQQLVSKLGPEIIRTLRKASTELAPGDVRSRAWFGDASNAWIQQVKRNLNRMASVINVQRIDVHGSQWQQRSKGTSAAAYQPASGWRDHTANVGNVGFITRSQNQGFNIELDIAWNKSPTYKTTANLDSKFEILVHELTHLILDTEDEAYGPAKCQALATASPARAKKNADTWGYFIEEFR
jgi:hypothetical protein